MSCTAFGVSNHSPEDVVSALLKSRIARKACDIGILPPASRSDASFKFLLLLSTEDFTRNLTRLNSADVKVFIFSNPIDLISFQGVRGLDYVRVDDFSFNYIPLDMTAVTKSTPTKISRLNSDFLPKLIESVRHGSLLNPLMTFIYSLSSVNQGIVKAAVVYYLYNGQPVKNLIDTLSSHLTERLIDKLLLIISTSVAQSYAAALQTVKLLRKQKKTVDVESVARASGTSAYELSYMLSVIDDKQTYSDSFNKAKNRKTGLKNDTHKSNRRLSAN